MRIEVLGGWIDIRERLKVKDERAILDFINPYVKGPVEDLSVTAAMIPANAVARSAARLFAWQLPGIKPLAMAAKFEQKVAAIEDLYPEQFKAIWDAISLYESEEKVKETEEKNEVADGVTA